MSNIHKRGFASLSKKRRKEIAARGGIEAHKRGTAHRFDSESAAAAGRKGGEATAAKRKGV